MKSVKKLVNELDQPTLIARMREFAERWHPVSYDTVKSWYYGAKRTPRHKLVLYNAFGCYAEAEEYCDRINKR